MNEIDVLRKLRSRSGGDRSPAVVDVTADVLATIRSQAESPGPSGPSRGASVLAMTVAWSAALLLAILAQQAAASLDDPFCSLVAPFVVTLR